MDWLLYADHRMDPICRSVTDAFLLAMALVSEVDYLVIGDHRVGLLQRGHFSRTRIVTPIVFCAEALTSFA